ncbi:hypothetical protein P152DRAFT_401634 [Eremomyces bilateralis CBS 781.70]|uniref:Ribosomal RNA-processing protein 40 n=1 Tax=Eremomyces bilateralis CBS 781.70 TaxID=1392243 RepID=A0A6G1FWM7_9PEZI|nr:uncharacterized protein P152DRAFT_401634 [Eremomyces bilateralis CBS 781.70]KAF1810174.1 hypothetical protein P152DRAFT_401634 [Eremomyces bilateralis CBS 781.70]
MAYSDVLLPGDEVPQEQLPSNPKKALSIGPGLRHIPPSTISATSVGALNVDWRRNAAWMDVNGGRYLPSTNDPIIVRVTGSSGEAFNCQITPYTSYAALPHLSFQDATKKTRPQLANGALVYARIATPAAHLLHIDPELTCIDPSTGKSEGLGPLKGGMLFKISLGMARRLLMTSKRAKEDAKIIILDRLGEKWGFEVAVGRNGYLWVDANDIQRTMAVGRAITEVDEQGLVVQEQEALAQKVLKQG